MFLRLAHEAGATPQQLQPLANILERARGTTTTMLPLQNQNQDHEQIERESYGLMERGCSLKQQLQLMRRVESEMQNARQKECHLSCLKQYMKVKQQQIAPSFVTNNPSKKDRFRLTTTKKHQNKTVNTSNCYEHSLLQILKNSFKNENECYKTMSNFIYLKTLFGHSAGQDIQSYSQCYNAILDRSERLIMSAGEEGMIKVWSREMGLLIATLKGHTEYINKIQTSKCNKYLLSTAGDGIRFFDLRTMTSLGGWKTDPILDITSLHDGTNSIFLFGDSRNLYLLKQTTMLARKNKCLHVGDFLAFSFVHLLRSQAILINISISSDQKYILLGFDTGHFILLLWEQLQNIANKAQLGDKFNLPECGLIKAHTDEIVEVKWSNTSDCFATGGKDGRCCLWQLKGDNRPNLLTTLSVSKSLNRRKKRTFSCTYICWNCSYTHFAAGFQQVMDEQDTERGQGQVIIYNALDRLVTCEFSKDISLKVGGVRAMDAHPYYPNILLICQAEGHIILFDIFLCCAINVFEERGYHIMHPQFCLIPTQCRFCKDGLSFIVSSQYGSVSIYGYDIKSFYNLCPNQQFLVTDFQKFSLQQNTMRAIPLLMEYGDDINTYPSGTIRNIRGQLYVSPMLVELQHYLQVVHHVQSDVSKHIANMDVEGVFLQKIQFNLKEAGVNQKIYAKTWQEIQNKKQIILFYQKQRQHLIVTDCWINKIKATKIITPQLNISPNNIQESPQEQQPMQTRRRKLKRNSLRQRVRYSDNFSDNNDSQQQDYKDVQSILEQQHDINEDQLDDDEYSDSAPVVRKGSRTRHHQEYHYQEESDRSVRPRRTAKEDIQQLLQHQDFINFHPRKRIKHDNHHLQQLPQNNIKYTRLHKSIDQQLQVDVDIDCFRCLCKPAALKCKNCEFAQQYCEECHLFRGKVSKNVFTCFICMFLQNHQAEQRLGVNQSYYRAYQRSNVFVPQIQDHVRYFFQGYQQFLGQNIKRLNNCIVQQNPLFRILPHTENQDLMKTPLCKVTAIEYIFPLQMDQLQHMGNKRTQQRAQSSNILMLIRLQVIPQPRNQELVQESKCFWVFYMHGYDFLLREEVYQQVSKNHVMSLFNINDLVQFQSQETQIVQVGPFEDRYPQSLWKMIKIRKTQGKRLRGNTKQIDKRVNIWKLNRQYNQHYISSISSKHSTRLQNQIDKWINDESFGYNIFVDYVDFDIYPSYRYSITVGMCLNTISLRLKHSYYTGYKSLQFDINLIRLNSQKFNGQTNRITIEASQMCERLLGLIKKQESENGSRKGYDDTTVKKQKRRKVEEEVESVWVNGRKHMQVVMKVNQQCAHRTRRPFYKQQSSDNIPPEDHSQLQNSKVQVKVSRLRIRPQPNHRLFTPPMQLQDISKRITRSKTKH